MNSFTQYWSGRVPAAVFLAAYPLGLRQPHEWEVFYYGLGGLELAREIYARLGMYYLGPVRHGANIIHSKKPIRPIEVFNGLRLRLPGGVVAELFPRSEELRAEQECMRTCRTLGALERKNVTKEINLKPNPLNQTT